MKNQPGCKWFEDGLIFRLVKECQKTREVKSCYQCAREWFSTFTFGISGLAYGADENARCPEFFEVCRIEHGYPDKFQKYLKALEKAGIDPFEVCAGCPEAEGKMEE